MVPMDYYPKRMRSEEEVKWLLTSAQASNLNLIRVWGGGMYPDDHFYELADSMGLLVW